METTINKGILTRETRHCNTTKNLQTTTIAGAKSTRLAQLQNKIGHNSDYRIARRDGRYANKVKNF